MTTQGDVDRRWVGLHQSRNAFERAARQQNQDIRGRRVLSYACMIVVGVIIVVLTTLLVTELHK